MLERPEVRKRLDRHPFIETRVMSPEEFTQFVTGEIAVTPVAKRVMQGN